MLVFQQFWHTRRLQVCSSRLLLSFLFVPTSLRRWVLCERQPKLYYLCCYHFRTIDSDSVGQIALPPSPADSPTGCHTPTSQTVDFNIQNLPLKADLTPVKRTVQEPEVETVVPVPESPEATLVREQKPQPKAAQESRTCNDEIPQNADKSLDVPSISQVAEDKPVIPEVQTISFIKFARQCQLQHHQRAQRRSALRRLWDLRVSIALSIRLIRVASTAEKGLVEAFKHGDKPGFISVYNTVHEIRDLCDSFSRHHVQSQDDLFGVSIESPRNSCSFVQRLTPRSQGDLLEILTRVRTDSDFLFQCIGSLSPAQLSALVSPAHSLEFGDTPSPFSSTRSKAPSLFSKRTSFQASAIKEYVVAFERTDSLSALLFNVFSAPLTSSSQEARLRLDVWSSTCAKLISYGGSGHYSFIVQLLSIWSGPTEWKAKPKFELYLMDILQKGAFLLEYPDSRRMAHDSSSFDPLRTDVAEQFFQSAVHGLFVVLDDSDAGFPAGAIELGNAILGKIGTPETRKRFLDFVFFQWFFRKFLPNALAYPEVSHFIIFAGG